ncbi:unnamed protein product [Paramecium octaurelia]|uniref:Uncharacterized protein n=1 Tax=Paramecium octaurelia TaxID=43137 RepID=A0A8S1UNX9_PAROT|nr:unnamed protein product [Paramecium octaurelia]
MNKLQQNGVENINGQELQTINKSKTDQNEQGYDELQKQYQVSKQYMSIMNNPSINQQSQLKTKEVNGIEQNTNKNLGQGSNEIISQGSDVDNSQKIDKQITVQISKIEQNQDQLLEQKKKSDYFSFQKSQLSNLNECEKAQQKYEDQNSNLNEKTSLCTDTSESGSQKDKQQIQTQVLNQDLQNQTINHNNQISSSSSTQESENVDQKQQNSDYCSQLVTPKGQNSRLSIHVSKNQQIITTGNEDATFQVSKYEQDPVRSGLVNQEVNANYISIPVKQSDELKVEDEKNGLKGQSKTNTYAEFLTFQQALCVQIKEMIQQAKQDPTKNISFKTKGLNPQSLTDTDKTQKEKLLEFFDGWISYTEENEYSELKYRGSLDFETECLNSFIEFVNVQKMKELKKLKELIEDENTLINWKNIMDKLQINDIQFFVMLCAIKKNEPSNAFTKWYIEWWFQWNKSSVFTKSKYI